MATVVLASASDIDRWAAARAAQDRVPELLRRLVYATTEAPTLVDFPSGDAVQLEGWDGTVVLNEDHSVIPKGVSGWETGTSKSPKTKADEDYENRSKTPPPTARGAVTPSVTSFVFVTPRRWPGKKKWSAKRRGENVWQDVRAVDADDLEAWLQQAPATHVWFSRLIGVLPAGADDLETTWADWSEATTPPTSAALVIAGRDKEVQQLTGWLNSGRGTFTVVAESSDDAIGFVGAAVMALPEGERSPVLARIVVATDPDAFAQLATSQHSLILVAAYAPGNEIHRATRSGHRVILPTGPVPGREAPADGLALPRVARDAAQAALQAMGVHEDRARQLGGVARRSMRTLRRRLATHPSLQTPRWAEPAVGPSLVPILLAGQFNESREADLQALAALSPAGLHVLRETLARWAQEIDPPVRHTGNLWYLVSKEDAWAALGRFVSSDDLKRFASVATDVLGEVHPKFDLPPDQRWVASIHGKERQYSGALVTGVADTLALLGSLADSAVLPDGTLPSLAAERIVSDALAAVAGDWRGWATLSRVLPLLAEAAPDAFLKAVDAQVAKDEHAARQLFQDSGNAMFSSFAHTGLLWALETLAWSPGHLAEAARVLASLDRLDPGGNVVNRPGNSLRSIFLSWLPQTSAGLDTRLAVLDNLRKQEPTAAWKLFKNLIPRWHDHSGHNPKPHWRDWVADGAGTAATYAEIFRQTSQLIEWMLVDAGDDPARWQTLIEALDDIGPSDFDAVLVGLRALLTRGIDDTARASVFDALREMLSKHRSFPDAQWAMEGERLPQIEELMIAATPADVFLRVRWLFTDQPQLPEGREDDYSEHEALVFERRKEAMRELHQSLGTDGVIDLIPRVERSDEFGRVFAMAGLLRDDEEDRMLGRLLSDSAATGSALAFARGYSHGWTARVGAQAAFARIRDERAWTDTVRGHLLLAQEPTEAVFDVADSLDVDGRAAFWVGVQPFWFKDGAVERGLRSVLANGRAHAFVDAAAMHVQNQPTLDPELLATGLEAFARTPAEARGPRVDAHDIGAILDALERAVRDGRFESVRLARLEFLFLPALGHFERPPRALHSSMASEPSLFIDSVKLAYRKSANDEGDEEAAQSEAENEEEGDDSSRAQLVQRAYHLLHGWRMPLEGEPDGVDEAALNTWVDQVRAALKSEGRQTIGDHLLGQALSRSIPDSDGAWPRIPIRNLVERLQSDEFDSGLRIGKYNSRGVISRNPLGGGDLERGEASAYEKMAATMGTRWPRTAAILRMMARLASAEASREDIESELREDLED